MIQIAELSCLLVSFVLELPCVKHVVEWVSIRAHERTCGAMSIFGVLTKSARTKGTLLLRPRTSCLQDKIIASRKTKTRRK
jgi:hypothetical protein